jgi:hypothetical protein
MVRLIILLLHELFDKLLLAVAELYDEHPVGKV